MTGVQTCALPICCPARFLHAVEQAGPAQGAQAVDLAGFEHGWQFSILGHEVKPAAVPGESIVDQLALIGRPQNLGPHRHDGEASAETRRHLHRRLRTEEHTSELQSLMRNSYAGFCLKK